GDGRFSYPRVIGTDDVIVSIESSTDLANWSAAEPLLSEAGRQYIGNGIELVTFQIIDQGSSEKAHFLRLRVSN
ncbi:MAG: hypothetical protein ACR2RV_04595, partial [Verrucomicrobiales bacterium]